jgi:predicted nucleic acid-binding protein
MVLVDTSVWIEYFKTNPRIQLLDLDVLIMERRVAICRPVYSEVCSGQMNSTTSSLVHSAFLSMPAVDVDWNDFAFWTQLADWAQAAYKNRIPACGLVDRMIVFCAKTAEIPLWTLDSKLAKLAAFVGVSSHP